MRRELLLRSRNRCTRIERRFLAVELGTLKRGMTNGSDNNYIQVEWLQKQYSGRCQICGFDPRTRYGHRLCHGHHIVWLCRGGEDRIRNMVLICPNHHAAVHQADAIFDFAGLEFRFANGVTERLQLNQHLRAA